jgi:RNA polymerase sigma-70 factor (ECF subfamily)
VIDATFQDWRPRLLRFCTQLLRNGHDAEEVVQDVFTTLVAHGNRYDLAAEPGVLLFRLARNRCIDVRRKMVVPTRDDVDRVATPAGRDQDLDEALAALPAAEREALLLTAVDGLGYREVAAILHCSLGTVAALRYAAIEKLRRRLPR